MENKFFVSKTEVPLLEKYKYEYEKAYEVIFPNGLRNIILEGKDSSVLIDASTYDGSSDKVYGTKWLGDYRLYGRYNKNGYVVVGYKNHPKSFAGLGNRDKVSSWCVYEHVLIAEDIIGRPLHPNEVVHHLDFCKSNNTPENLLVLSSEMHGKLHSWLDRYNLTPKSPNSLYSSECNRCRVCGKPCSSQIENCSIECYKEGVSLNSKMPDRDTLIKLVSDSPMTKVAKLLGVSDVAVRKWCKKLDIDLGNRRGYWAKQYSSS